MKVVQANGDLTKSGGQVVKNVSGYDMARLHIGGIGTLGIIAEVSFKLTPLPQKQATVLASFDTLDASVHAGTAIFHSHVLPLSLTAFNSTVNRRASVTDQQGEHFLTIRLGGRSRSLERQIDECTRICKDCQALTVETLDDSDADRAWRRIADFGWDDETHATLACRAFVSPTSISELTSALESVAGNDLEFAVVSHPGYGTISLFWLSSSGRSRSNALKSTIRRAREATHQLGGRLVIDNCPTDAKSEFDVWDQIGEPLKIMLRLKEQYDSKRILNPGRFAGGI